MSFGASTPPRKRKPRSRKKSPKKGSRNRRTSKKGYTEKQWGRDCKQLPASIIKRLPLRFEYNNNYFNDIYQGQPKGGYTPFIENLLKGIEVKTGVDYLKDKLAWDEKAAKIVYTGRLDEYFGFSLGRLDWRSLRFEVETLDQEDFQHNAVVNYTEREPAFTRITEHKHFDPSLKCKKTVITKEYPDSFEEGKIPYYTINDDRNTALSGAYKVMANKQPNVIFLGRLAEYRYYDMDDSILRAMEVAESLL